MFSEDDEPNFTEIYDQEKKARKDSSSELSSSDFYGKKIRKQKIKNKIKNRIFICLHCHFIPKIKFIKNNLLEIECRCRKISNIPPRKFIADYGKKKSLKKYIICDKHKKQFQNYCIDCFCNVCNECAKLKEHKNHKKTFKNLTDRNIKKKIETINDLIGKIQPNLDKNDSENRLFLNIIITTIYNYYESICYNQYCNIEECEKFLTELEIKIQDNKMVENIKITKYEELDDILNPHLISSISIKDQKNFDFAKIKNMEFKKLTEIQIAHCDIENISAFQNIKNKETVKELNLAQNKIDDKNLKNLNDYKNLELLNLFENKLQNYETFDFLKNFTKLKTLYIGRNEFITNNNYNNYKNYDKKFYFNKLKILGITGCFNNENAHLISNLKCKDLESLYVSRNKLSTINFMKNFDSEKLTNFWATDNDLVDISELDFLKAKKTLETINLNRNKIRDLNWLFVNIEQFPKLKELLLIGNPISEESKALVEEIQKKTNSRLKIILEEKNIIIN